MTETCMNEITQMQSKLDEADEHIEENCRVIEQQQLAIEELE